jgi:hypothetical protein
MCTKNHQLKEKAKGVPRRTGDTKRQQQTVAARLKTINYVSPAPMWCGHNSIGNSRESFIDGDNRAAPLLTSLLRGTAD